MRSFYCTKLKDGAGSPRSGVAVPLCGCAHVFRGLVWSGAGAFPLFVFLHILTAIARS